MEKMNTKKATEICQILHLLAKRNPNLSDLIDLKVFERDPLRCLNLVGTKFAICLICGSKIESADVQIGIWHPDVLSHCQIHLEKLEAFK